MFPELASTPITESILLAAGVIAIVIGILGKSDKTIVDDVAIAMGFLLGAFMIFLGLVLITEGGWPPSTIVIVLVVGLALFFRVLRKVKWAAIIAWIAGGVVGYLLHLLSKVVFASILTPTVIIVVAAVVVLISYIMLKLLEDTFSFVGAIISFRPILFCLGVIAVVEAVLLFSGESLYSIFG